MKQLSDPAELLAAHTYFPDMLLLRSSSTLHSLSMGEKKTSERDGFPGAGFAAQSHVPLQHRLPRHRALGNPGRD
ncbi:hypothetical protein EYF80_038016 [Liparis tanakae]|uniref:Uncharacterized protein n=1 Tax=Liparis tanakae TaxID=230148 RepID=A0A4Z2GE22_9TELE|nr:hypothetical protein EYF80_038016 [Liparis tanakae]